MTIKFLSEIIFVLYGEKTLVLKSMEFIFNKKLLIKSKVQ